MTATTTPARPTATSRRTEPMRKGRQADSARRRQRVIATLTRPGAPLQAYVLAAHERSARPTARVRRLENRLSEPLGERAWRESGLGAPADIDALSQQITHLEQQAIDLRLQLEERDQDLAAARAANRELMAQLNAMPRHG